MRNLHVIVAALALAAPAHAQSQEDRKASLVGLNHIAIKESGVQALGGGTHGSPYITQVNDRFKQAGISMAELDTAAESGKPVYEVLCTAMDWGDMSVRVACESRLMRQVSIPQGDNQKGIYAITWTSKLVVASFQDRQTASSRLEELTATLADQFITDWQAANPGAKPLPGAKKPKKK